MSLLPDDASYLEQVQAYFLAFRGDGLVLSPLDAQILDDWHSRGVPYQVVCRGIRKAAEVKFRDARPGEARLRTLRSCRSTVEREFKRFEGLSAGATQAPSEKPPEHFAVTRLKKARSAIKKALSTPETPAHGSALSRAFSVLDTQSEDPRIVSQLVSRADDLLAICYVRALPVLFRRRLVKDARTQAGPRPEGATARARKDALRAHLVALARAHGALPSLA